MELSDAEKKKYERIWAIPSYAALSPGEKLAPLFLRRFKPKRGERLIDFGCGTARAAKIFLSHGLSVELVDHCTNCLDPSILSLPILFPCRFWEACLWLLPEELPCAEWGFCCDVMEHIPPEKVSAVLSSIASRVTRKVFFSIFLKKDLFGDVIGERLHLTLESRSWWQEELLQHFAQVEMVMGNDEWVWFQASQHIDSNPVDRKL